MPVVTVVLMPDAIALFDQRITNPVEPRHYMQIKAVHNKVQAVIAGRVIASTHDSIRLQEVGYTIYPPVIYFPHAAIVKNALTKTAKSTFCPLKGTTEYFAVLSENGLVIQDAAWRYSDLLTFDDQLMILQNRVAFDATKVNIFEHSADEASSGELTVIS